MVSGDTYNGMLLLDKPSGMTSHEAVKRARYLLDQKTVGHTGTLDPLAEGLLVLCVGRGTKITQFVSDFSKKYEAELRLGMRSPTFDAEGISPDSESLPVPAFSPEVLTAALESFVGRTKQTVPYHSSVRVDGRHLYELARKGEETELPVREVEITSIRLAAFETPYLRLEVSCRKGTYIRALANDIGERLGCGAYLSHLKRTEVGPFRLSDALSFEAVRKYVEAQSLDSHLLPIEVALRFSALRLREEAVRTVINGQTPLWADIETVEGEFHPGDSVVVIDPHGAALAVGVAGADSGDFSARAGKPLSGYIRVFN